MKKLITKIGKAQFTVNVPETIEEFDQQHKRAGAVLDQGIKYDVAHTILSKIRTGAGAKLVERGFARDVASTNADGTVNLKPIDTKWLDRGFLALGMSLSDQSALYQEVADEVGYDVSGTRGGSKEYNQTDLRDAKQVMELITLGKTTYDKLRRKLEGRNPGLEIEVDENGIFTVEALAGAFKTDRLRIEQEKLAEYTDDDA